MTRGHATALTRFLIASGNMRKDRIGSAEALETFGPRRGHSVAAGALIERVSNFGGRDMVVELTLAMPSGDGSCGTVARNRTAQARVNHPFPQ